jgi:hypothetical protein
MKRINSRKVVIAFGGILAATLATGCFGGGGRGYSNDPYGYDSSYSSYGSSYPHSGYENGYSYPRSSENSYNSGYQNGVRADEKRDYKQHAEVGRDSGESHAKGQHSRVDRDNYSRNDSERGRSTERN